MDDLFTGWWTASLAASRVRTSQTQGSERELPAPSPVSGSTTSESSPKLNLDWSSLRTSRRSSKGDSMSSSKTLPRSGMMQRGVLSELPMLEPLTLETACSLWPTPDASVSVGSNRGGQQGRVGVDRPALARLVRLWPTTTTTQDSIGSGSHGYGPVSKSTGMSRSEGVTLTDKAVRLWQTPRATDGDKGGPNQRLKGVPSLVAEARRRLWPTTTTHNSQDSLAPAEFLRKSPELTARAFTLLGQMNSQSGQKCSPSDRTLNPRFVEWLMGWPIGWTDCDSRVTEWFLLRPLTLSDNSSEDSKPT